MESRAIVTDCRLAGATAAWLRRCTEAVARACQDAHAGTEWARDEEERVYYFNLDCSAASARLLVL
jgi:hypothetical protein